ncbi:hypothetical protein ACTJKU_36335, partial [Citrobacter freundii]
SRNCGESCSYLFILAKALKTDFRFCVLGIIRMNGLIKGVAKKLPENVNSTHKCAFCLSTAMFPLPIIYGCVVWLIFRGE